MKKYLMIAIISIMALGAHAQTLRLERGIEGATDQISISHKFLNSVSLTELTAQPTCQGGGPVFSIAQNSDTLVFVTECDSFLFNGKYLSNTGAYTDTLKNINNLDSVVDLILRINKSTRSAFADTGCMSYMFNGNLLTSAGTYSDTLINASGCDSVVTLNLYLDSLLRTNLSYTACDSFLFNGRRLDSSGVYTDSLMSSSGCDSIVRLDLQLGYSSSSVIYDTACFSYQFGSKLLVTSGIFIDTFYTPTGCDSIVELNLRIPNNLNTLTIIDSCEQVTFRGVVYTAGKLLMDTFQSIEGCDSLTTTLIRVLGPTYRNFVLTECGEYNWNGRVLSQSGVYRDTLVNWRGCDSVLRLTLTIESGDTLVRQNRDTLQALGSLSCCFAWLDCDSDFARIIGGPTFVATKNGSYALEGSTINGCRDTSACYRVSVVGFEDLAKADVVLRYGSGLKNAFLVIQEDNWLDAYSIFSLSGALLYQGGKLNAGQHMIPMESLASGIYMLRIRQRNQSYQSLKLIKP